ncbi:hypothetical protein E1301_Tti014583 [Triplophysa tibetana]|uniref:B box-type domain-containing protein n=1 Tax=Triplophysa tibetana TaxID=1572043 RepID=A0A5A9P9T1_9TELE|nr:hypothetical protein E1301_Tti014583 [Triplophysa tibetana]
MSCITDCWNQEDQKRVYSCPQCREIFTPRPALGKNVILAEMMEKLKKTKLQTDGAAPIYAGPEDVKCDVCTGSKRKASKSCLVCLNSYCQTHFERHEELQSGKRHKVTEATGRLQEMICSQHDRLLEVFCRTDQKLICLLCTIDEHKSHDTVSAAAERTVKQSLLEDKQRKHQQRIGEKEKKLHHLRENVKIDERSAQTAVEDTERIFTELIRSIERRRSEVIKLIRDQEKTAVSRAEGLLKELEQEIEDLRRRHDEMEQLSHTEDHISFLQSFLSLSESPGSTNNTSVSSLISFDDVRKSVTQLKVNVEDLCKEEIEKMSDKVSIITTKCSFRHKYKRTELPVVSSSCRIGVYVDHSAGILSFYSVSDTMTLIHRVHSTFTQPLYPGFGLRKSSTVKLCDF